MVLRRLKKMMVRAAGRNSRPNTEAPRVPSEKVEVVLFAASHIHMQSDKRWVWFLSLGRTRSIPRHSTPSRRSMIFHSWGGGLGLAHSNAGETYLVKDSPPPWDAIRIMMWTTLFGHLHGVFFGIGRFLNIGRVMTHCSTIRLLSRWEESGRASGGSHNTKGSSG